MTARKVEGWFVAESRPWTGDDGFIFGDDWSRYCRTREEADATAAQWRRNSPARPFGTVGVFALVRVDEATEVPVPSDEFEATVFAEHGIGGNGHNDYYTVDPDGTAHYTTDAGVHLVAHLPKAGA